MTPTTARVGAAVAALVLLAWATAGAAAAPTPPAVSTALLVTSGPANATASDTVQYLACSLGASDDAFLAAEALAAPSPLTEVAARFWGRLGDEGEGGSPSTTTAPIRDFGTTGCSTVWLAGGRAVRVHDDEAADCEVTWSAAPGAKGGAVLTARKKKANSSTPLWELTLSADGRAPAKLACAGACPLTASAPPCTPAALAGLGLGGRGGKDGVVAASTSSFAQVLSGAESTCVAGAPAPEGTAPFPAPPGLPLSYGLAGRFYPQVYGPAECAAPTPWSWYGLPPDMEAGPGASPERCVPAVDFRAAAGTPWANAGQPPLGPEFGSCFGATLAGWVRLPNVTDAIVFNVPGGTPPNAAAYGDRFRVCVRFSAQLELVLAGSPVALSSPDPRVDVTFTCQEITLPGAAGSLVPLSVLYAAPPISGLHVLQLWVIPVAAVYELGPAAGGGTEVVYKCDACTPFSPVADACCPPLGSCAFRSVCGEGGGGGGGGTPTPPPTPELTTPPPATTEAPPPPTTTPGSYGTAPPTPPSTIEPPATTSGSYGTSPPTTVPADTTAPPVETTPPPETTTAPPPPPPTTTPGGGYGYGTPPATTTPAPPPETTPPHPETTTPPPATCPPGNDEFEAAARRDWTGFQSAVAGAANVEELELLLDLV